MGVALRTWKRVGVVFKLHIVYGNESGSKWAWLENHRRKYSCGVIDIRTSQSGRGFKNIVV